VLDEDCITFVDWSGFGQTTHSCLNFSSMDKVSASVAKQKLGEYLERASSGPLAIEKHGRVVAGLVPPDWLARADLLDERRQARQAQQRVELERLLAHHRIAMDLLIDKGRRRELLDGARKEVRRWSQHG